MLVTCVLAGLIYLLNSCGYELVQSVFCLSWLRYMKLLTGLLSVPCCSILGGAADVLAAPVSCTSHLVVGLDSP
jgi:hypothetical protein